MRRARLAFAENFQSTIYWSVGGVFISGLYNFLTKPSYPPHYHMWFGIKFLLALHVMAALVLAVRRQVPTEKLERSLRITLISATAVILISNYLRWISLSPVGEVAMTGIRSASRVGGMARLIRPRQDPRHRRRSRPPAARHDYQSCSAVEAGARLLCVFPLGARDAFWPTRTSSAARRISCWTRNRRREKSCISISINSSSRTT